MAVLTPVAKMQFFDVTGAPLVGGLLYTYAAGTTTPQVTYTDSTGSQANTNPVVLNARGEANIWLGSSTYKFRLCSSDNTEIWTVDNISAPTSSLSPVLSGNVTIDSDSAGPALKITQTGTGPVLRVQDSIDPDVTPFIIDSTGQVGIGTQSPSTAFDVNDGVIQLSSSGTSRTTISADASNTTINSPGSRGLLLATGGTTRVTISSAGVVTFSGATVFSGGATITGNVAVTGTLSSTSTLTVSAGGASITGGLTVPSGGAAITGNSTVTGTLNATSTLTAQNGLTVSAGGATVTAGGLTVTAGGLTVSAGGAGITGNSTVTGTLTSTSTLTAQNGLTVSAGGAAITGNSSVTGTLYSTGAFSADTVQGYSSANTITVGGIAIVSSQIPAANRLITAATSQATTSGTSFNFSSIPSWVKRITFMMNAVSTNGTVVRIRLGTGGTPATSGYNSICGVGGGSVVSTAGFDLSLVNATYDLSGAFTFTNLSGNLWVAAGVAALNIGANTITLGGAITLGGVLDILQVTSSTGTDTFDAGSINILYE